MIIQSDFRDFYDFVGPQTGSDINPNAILYKRGNQEYPHELSRFTTGLCSSLLSGVNNLRSFHKYTHKSIYPLKFDYLIICGYKYLVVDYIEWKRDKILSHSTIVNENDRSLIWGRAVEFNRVIEGKTPRSSVAKQYNFDFALMMERQGKLSSIALKLIKLIKQPVFRVSELDHWLDKSIVLTRVPNLGDHNVSSVFTPEQLYQTIDSCLSDIEVSGKQTSQVQ